MTRVLALIFAMALAILCGCAKVPADLIVGKMTDPMLTSEAEFSNILWNSNRLQSTNCYTVNPKTWKNQYKNFSRELLRKADAVHLDSTSLAKILALIMDDESNGHCIYLPAEAYQADLDHKAVWIVVLQWEFNNPNAPYQHAPFGLGHIRMYAYSISDLKQIAFETCR